MLALAWLAVCSGWCWGVGLVGQILLPLTLWNVVLAVVFMTAWATGLLLKSGLQESGPELFVPTGTFGPMVVWSGMRSLESVVAVLGVCFGFWL